MAKKKLDYVYIRAWGQMMGSFNYYIDNQVADATKDGAPQNAIYKDCRGKWHTFDDITNEQTKLLVANIVAQRFT